ncbi:MAG: CPXCG motif-containing cysteine-rich protein [Xanthomonadaceae bacterium]|nr:CPXCG motif-containing cysteine-rich protein [Xanthomonadaceae bacterium]MDE1965033.1 CPXCG motif-containing cysteine-rich protein [Xanthomonadaceae bacterium]
MLDAVLIDCPYCGEPIEILVEPAEESHRYIEDCQVCCRPITVSVQVDMDGSVTVGAGAQDDV